jgi:hypothetical protein
MATKKGLVRFFKIRDTATVSSATVPDSAELDGASDVAALHPERIRAAAPAAARLDTNRLFLNRLVNNVVFIELPFIVSALN